jgi:hypothetical protein
MSVKFIATVAGVNGPIASCQDEAVVRLREYMEGHLGKRHFHDANPDSEDQDYQEALFKLYEKEEGKVGEASLSGLKDTQAQPNVVITDLD